MGPGRHWWLVHRNIELHQMKPSFLCPAYLGGDKLGKLLGVPQVGICEARMDAGKELGKGIRG